MDAPVVAPSEAMVQFSPVDSVVPEDDEARKSPAAAAEERNWPSLPRNILSVIFRKAGPVCVMTGAQWVCRSWRMLSWEPRTWQVVDMTMHSDNSSDTRYLVEIAREVIARSNGVMEEFCAKNFVDDGLLEYIAERTNGGLKKLCLISCGCKISHISIIELAKRSPQLECLDISFCSISPEFVEAVGNACPCLKLFRLNRVFKQEPSSILFGYSTTRSYDIEASGIANSMKELRHLELVGSSLSNYALHGILDNCRHLESLDIRDCYNININYDDSLRKKFVRINDLKLPVAIPRATNAYFYDHIDDDYDLFSRDVCDYDCEDDYNLGSRDVCDYDSDSGNFDF